MGETSPKLQKKQQNIGPLQSVPKKGGQSNLDITYYIIDLNMILIVILISVLN
jgi:hypothetical protein